MANPISRGFFGKIPSRGDFVGRGLPSSFVKPWETWVVEALKSSRSLLGETWSEAWMEAPVWRFALPGGTCGPDAALGLVLPSIDRVGRAWPLVIAAVFHGCQKTPDAARGKHFLDETEDAALDAIAADMEPDMLAQRISDSPSLEFAQGDSPQALWWTDGAPRVAAQHLIAAGLPPMPDHAALLAGGESS